MIGGLGYVLAPGNAAYTAENRCRQRCLGPTAEPGAGRDADRPVGGRCRRGTRFISSPRVLSDLFWMGRYGERTENLARLLIVTRERYHEYRYRQDMEGSECVPVLLGALGAITGTDTGADRDLRRAVAVAQRTLWSLTVDRAAARVAGPVGRTARTGRPVGARPDVQRHLDGARRRRAGAGRAGRLAAAATRVADRRRHPAGRRPAADAGRHAGAVRGGRRVDGARRRLDDDGHRQAHRTRAGADRAAARAR